MKIVVLAGGLSTERLVALTSGTGVCRALRERGHKAILVDMFLGLENYEGRLEDIFDAPDGLCPDNRVESEAPDLEAVRRSRKDQSPSMLGKDVLTVCRMADIVFLALHGACGEDGRIQATLDLLGVPYTGSGYLGSGMAMDKALTKQVMERSGVRTAPWHNIYYTEADIPRLVEELEVPCAVKIVNGGSSIGVELPDTKEELEQALRHLLAYGNHVVVEKKIHGREIQIAVLGDKYLPAVEIIPQGEQRVVHKNVELAGLQRSGRVHGQAARRAARKRAVEIGVAVELLADERDEQVTRGGGAAVGGDVRHRRVRVLQERPADGAADLRSGAGNHSFAAFRASRESRMIFSQRSA